MITAQGYSVDLPDCDTSFDQDSHLKVGDRGFAYSEMQPGKHRIVAFMDFGIFKKPFIDPARVEFLRKHYEECFDLKLSGEN